MGENFLKCQYEIFFTGKEWVEEKWTQSANITSLFLRTLILVLEGAGIHVNFSATSLKAICRQDTNCFCLFPCTKDQKMSPKRFKINWLSTFWRGSWNFSLSVTIFTFRKAKKNYYFVFVFCFSAQCVCLLPRCSEQEPACKWNKGNRKYTPLRPPFRKSYQ